MKLSSTALIITVTASAGFTSAFSPSKATSKWRQLSFHQGGHGREVPLGMVSAYQTGGRVNVADEYAPRDVYSMEEWASQYGVQKADGVQ
jgi:hypothetical protein